MERRRLSHRGWPLISLLWACSPSDQVEIWAKTEEQTVRILIESISLRALEHAWYEEWHLLEPTSTEILLDPQYQLIATGSKAHEQYQHIFLDGHSAFLGEEEIGDILEPISLDKIMRSQHNHVYLDTIVLDAPRGTSFFLTDASVR